MTNDNSRSSCYNSRVPACLYAYSSSKRDSVISAPEVPWGLAGFSPFSPSGILWTGGTQSILQPPRYPGDWRDSVSPSTPQVLWGLAGLKPFHPPPSTLGTGATQSFQPLWNPEDWRDSVLSAPQVAWGLGPPKRTDTGESLTESLLIDTGTYSDGLCKIQPSGIVRVLFVSNAYRDDTGTIKRPGGRLVCTTGMTFRA